MTKALLALAVAAVAVTAAAPSDARNRHHGRDCAQWRHGHCVRWANHGYRVSTAAHARWRTGYVFGPRYAYTPYNSLPRTYVTRYSLNPDYRYVYRDNRVYVVNPRTYAVERVIDALTR
jgi:hypothetical protein